eukprot:10141702-Karenia_brevis.AAC.1
MMMMMMMTMMLMMMMVVMTMTLETVFFAYYSLEVCLRGAGEHSGRARRPTRVALLRTTSDLIKGCPRLASDF